MPELLTRARHAARAAQLVAADEILAGILRVAPQEAGAWLLRSQIALQFRQFERSLESADSPVVRAFERFFLTALRERGIVIGLEATSDGAR